ncbi:hypothetical protein, partial [Klebsiella pneumoniae]|uniref:hypothetical protein n=1 Tax=Klebsiella pneumoniae TaxID=573 RepID=UPI001BADA099
GNLRYEDVTDRRRQRVLSWLLTLWQGNLPEHPRWTIGPQPELVCGGRKILLRRFGLRDGENTLYQSVLRQVSRYC